MAFAPVIYLLALFAAGLASFITLPLCRKLCLRMGLVDDPGERKLHQLPMPLAGGLAIQTAAVIAWLAWLYLAGGKLSAADAHAALVFFVSGAAMLLVGLADDKYELRAAPKLALQLAAAFLVASTGARITLFVPSVFFSYAVTVLWIVTVINAFNFMDNMNGLCTGLGAIAALSLGMAAIGLSQPNSAVLAVIACGAMAGFLPHNYPRANAFLGDSGSHLLGGWVAVLTILPSFHSAAHPNPWAVLAPLLILAVPLADLFWVVALRWRSGQPFYVGDTNHLSHRLVRRGLSPATAVLRIWVLSAVAGALALSWIAVSR